jgi:hypothetical protein
MNKQLFLCKKSVIGVLLLAMVSVTAIAQSVQIKQGSSPVSGYYCMAVDNPGTSFTVEGVSLTTDPNVTATIVSTTWEVFGGIQKVSESGTNVSVAPMTGTTYATQYSKYAKGKLRAICHVQYIYQNTPAPCPGDTAKTYTYTYYVDYTAEVEIRKIFDMPDGLVTNAIVGPECVLPGDSITYSVAPWVSLYQMNQVGFDSYYWSIPTGVNAGNLYYSADSSSVTFTAGNDIAGKTINVKMGACNTTQTPLTFTLGQEPADPVFKGKNLNSYCLPFGTLTDTIIISNPQPAVTYTWDLRSWTPDYTSEKGDTIVYIPLNNAQTITLKMNGGCADKTFIYDINRSLDSTSVISTSYGSCLPKNKDVAFSIEGVPVGTEMAWSLDATALANGWTLSAAEAKNATPIIHVGTGNGRVYAETADCGSTSIYGDFRIKPDVPGSITGETCLDIDSTSTLTYSVSPVLNATEGYQWSYPAGWQVYGNDSVSASIDLIPNGDNGGQIKVRAIGCDTSAWSTPLSINMNPNKPEGYLVNSCVDAGLAGEITVKVDSALSDLTYDWTILNDSLGTITTYSNPSDPSERVISTTGYTGTFLVTVSSVSATCGASPLDTLSINVNKDDLDFNFLSRDNGDIFDPKYWYQLDLSPDDLNWYYGHNFEWYYEGIGNVTHGTVPYRTTDNLPSGLLTQSTEEFYLIVTDTLTGCKTKKIATTSGMRSAKTQEAVNPTSITVYPNPASSEIQLTSDYASNLDYSIYDINGKFIKKASNVTPPVSISVANLNSGMYVVYAKQNGILLNTTFIKK